MKIPHLLLLAVSLLFAIHAGAAETTKPETSSKPKPSAKKEEPKKKESAEPKGKTYPYYGQVEAVTSRTLTLKGSEKNGPRKLSISAQTRIVKDGKPAKADEIKVGRWVSGGAAKTEAGNERAVTINLSAKQKAAKPAAPATTQKAPKKKSE